MSSPIAVPRAQSSSSSSSSSMASSPASSVSSTSLYVPLHKRSASPASPARSSFDQGKQQSQVYSASFLLSLRPKAEESMKEKMRASCPEVVMNRRMRKSIEFHEHQLVKAQRQQAHGQEHHNAHHNSHSHSHSHQHADPHHASPPHSPSKSHAAPTPSTRKTEPISQSTGSKNVFQALSSTTRASVRGWRGMRVTTMPLAVI